MVSPTLAWHARVQRASMAAAEGVAWQLLQRILADTGAPAGAVPAPAQPPSPPGSSAHLACRVSASHFLQPARAMVGMCRRAAGGAQTARRPAAAMQHAQQERGGHADEGQAGDADGAQGLRSSPPALRAEDFVVAVPTHGGREGLLPSHRAGRQVRGGPSSPAVCQLEVQEAARGLHAISLSERPAQASERAREEFDPAAWPGGRARQPSSPRTTATTAGSRRTMMSHGVTTRTRRCCAASSRATSEPPSCPYSHTGSTRPLLSHGSYTPNDMCSLHLTPPALCTAICFHYPSPYPHCVQQHQNTPDMSCTRLSAQQSW